MTVLKLVPWTDVIRNAPQVADGARKLWDSVNKKSAPPLAASAVPLIATGDLGADLRALQQRLEAQEAISAELHAQMVASSELIKTLADQNAQLVARVEANRVRAARLAAFAIMLGAVALLSLIVALVRT